MTRIEKVEVIVTTTNGEQSSVFLHPEKIDGIRHVLLGEFMADALAEFERPVLRLVREDES